MVPRPRALHDAGPPAASAVLRDVAAGGAAADYEREGLQGHGAEELFAGSFYGCGVERGGGGCGGGRGGRDVVAHECAELGVVGGADVDVGEGVGGVEEFGGGAEVWDGFPYEERFSGAGVQFLAAA